MDFPKEILERFPQTKKSKQSRWYDKWKASKKLKSKLKSAESAEPKVYCSSCKLFGHTICAHEKNASMYEVIRGNFGCEVVLAYPEGEQYSSDYLIFRRKYQGKKWRQQLK